MNNIEASFANLRDLMTVPAMTAERHAAIRNKEIEQRRHAEDMRDAISAGLSYIPIKERNE